MRKRRSPKGAQWLRWPQAPRWAGLVLAGGLVLLSTVGLQAQSDKGLAADRGERVDRAQGQQAEAIKADAEIWSPTKIMLNLDARCPVVLTLGFFGAYATHEADPVKTTAWQARFAELQKTIAPIAEELKRMAVSTPFVGQKFPAALNARLEALCGELYGAVVKLYGDAGLAEIKQYVALSTQGAVVDRMK